MLQAADILVWETCLRSIAFANNPGALEITDADVVYSHQQAYQFLLEVMCGLHSPVVGETEVFGQFKNFAKRWVKAEPQRASLVQRLFSDVKEIRSEHLCNLGTQSYGSWLKRKVKARHVHILGGGNLAQEIAPYLLKMCDSVTLHVRDPQKVQISGAQICSFKAAAFSAGALIVAAPLTAPYIQQWLQGRAPTEIFDLRDTSGSDPLSIASGERHVLNDVFNEIERTKSLLLPIIALVKSEILERSERTATQVHVRPQGWDDICA